MTEPTGELTWSDEVRKQIQRHPSAAIASALADVAVRDPTARAWTHVDGNAITVYVAEPGWLHRLSGPQDPYLEPRQVDEPCASTCAYWAHRLTRRATFEMKLTNTTRGHRRGTVDREWTFHFGDGERLSLKSPERASESDPDPAEFARYLATLITGDRLEQRPL